MKKNYQVHIPVAMKSNLSEIEISAAIIMADYFHKDITVIERNPNSHTADFLIGNQVWEHKAPRGDGKRTMQNNLRCADKQSSRVIVDLRRCKMRSSQAIHRLKHEMNKATKIEHLLVIEKSKKVLELE